MNGPFGNRFPYTNFHEMNLDWMIQIARDFLDQYTNIQETIQTGLDDLGAKATELEGLLQDWYDTHSQDIADQLADALADLNEWYTDHQGYLDQILLDNIAAFNTAAEQKAIETRATIPQDYTALADSSNIFTRNLFPSYYPLTLHSGYGILAASGTLSGSSVYYYSDRFNVFPGTLFIRNVINGDHQTFGVAFFDEEGTYITGTNYGSGGDLDLSVPSNAKQAAITVYKDNIDTYSIGYVLETDYNTVKNNAKTATEKTAAITIGRNLFNKNTITENKWINGSGVLSSNNLFDTSDYIPVTPGKVYCVSHKFSWCAFDSNKSNPSDPGNTNIFIPGVNDAFIRFSFYKTDIDDVQFEENDYTTTYNNYSYRMLRSGLAFEDVSADPTNFFNKDTISNGYLDDSGTVQSSSSYSVSQFIKLESGKYYTCYGIFGSAHIYDAAGTHVRKIDCLNYKGKNICTFYTAATDILLRVSFYQGYANDIIIEKNIGLSMKTDNVKNVVSAGRIAADTYKTTYIMVGTGAYFSTITSALNAILDATERNRYVLFIYPGSYEETFTTKNYVDIIGQNKNKCIVNYTSDNEEDYVNRSTIFAATNTRIENLTITTTGSKYPLHIDANYGMAFDLHVKNCIIKHNGFVDTSIAPGGTGVGIGLHFDQYVTLEECIIAGTENVLGVASVYCHNDNENPEADYSAYHRQITIKNCKLIDSYYGIRLDAIETYTGQKNSAIIIGNVNNAQVPYIYNSGSYDSWNIYAINNTTEYNG